MREVAEQKLPQGWTSTKLSTIVEPRTGKVNPRAMPDAKFVGLERIEAHTMKLFGTIPADSVKGNANIFNAGAESFLLACP